MSSHRFHSLPARRRSILVAALVVASIGGTATAVNAVFAAGERFEVSLTDATAQPAGVFVAVTPIRVLDTRPAPNGPIGVATSATLAPGATMDLALAGDGKAIPTGATSAFLNITIDEDANLQSYLTVWPTGEPRPVASANNALPGLVASNSMLAKIGTNGSISIFNQQGAINVVVDVVGYLVPLASADGPGAELFSGAGAPLNTIGHDGDFYLDTVTGVLYGPKAGGLWPTPGINLAGAPGVDAAEGAASAYNTAPATILAPTLAGAPITFDTAGPADGSVTRTNATTFTVAGRGLYTIDFHLAFSLAVPGSIRVAVNGVPTGPASTLTALVTQISNAVLVTANAGDTIQLMFLPTTIGTSIGLGNSSIVIQQTTTT